MCFINIPRLSDPPWPLAGGGGLTPLNTVKHADLRLHEGLKVTPVEINASAIPLAILKKVSPMPTLRVMALGLL